MTTLLFVLAAVTAEPSSPTSLPITPPPSIVELAEAAASAPMAPSAPRRAAARPADDFPELEYTFIEANYTIRDSDDADDKLDGWNLTGSLELPLNFFLQGTVSDWSGDADVQEYRIGAGWHFGLIPRLDAYGILSYNHLEYDDSTGDFSDDGTAAELGLRFMLTRSLEANGRFLWVDADGSDSGAGLGARYYITDFLSAGANYDVIGDDELIAAGLRFEF